ncbi:flagellar motor protein [Paraburkholderia sacchari]|uniref:Flagellar motor protein n=1 Tax=Paraburkholderia sacchari TaxID=159450 RepID=A0A8T6Z4Q2_9BURK|nr:flagellar motor protein [Paraburkholderia sacchari]
MDLATLFGVLLGGAAIAVGFSLEGGQFASLLQPEALLVVLGGTLAAVMIQNTWARFFDAILRLRTVFVRAQQVDEASLAAVLEWGDQAKLNGLLAFESMDWQGIHPFARRGLELLASGVSTAVLEDALNRELEAYGRAHMAAARVWQQAGGYAPTFGILGSVLGLIQVTAHLVEPSQLGQGIAVAFVATLYGLALANLVFLPLYGKMRAHIESELRLRKLYLDGLLAISRKETPHTIATRLAGEVGGRGAGMPGEPNAWSRQGAHAGAHAGTDAN